MKIRLLLLSFFIVALSLSATSQTSAYTAGYVSNGLFTLESSNFGNFDVERKPGYFIGVELHDLEFSKVITGIGLRLVNYKNNLVASSNSSLFNTDVELNKTVIEAAIYLYKVKLWKGATLMPGLTFDFLLTSQNSGTHESVLFFPTFPPISTSTVGTMDINELGSSFMPRINLGTNFSLMQRFSISSKSSIALQYNLYVSLSKELNLNHASVRSLRHYLGVGITRTIER